MAISAKISPENAVRGTVSALGKVQARTIAMGAPTSLGDLIDVNLEGVDDGSMLIYDGSSNKFVARREIQNANTKIIGGSF
jgi:hypothetical protein